MPLEITVNPSGVEKPAAPKPAPAPPVYTGPDVCEVIANGRVHRHWLNVAVRWSADDPRRTFTVNSAEPSELPGVLRLTPGDDVDVRLGGRPAIIGGKIVSRQAAINATAHAVQVDGFSLAGDTTRSAALTSGGEYRNYDITAIANAELKRFGLTFSIENGPPGSDLKFDVVRPHHGESVFHFIERLARMRDLLITGDERGNYIAGLPEGGSGATLEMGRNILSATCVITDEAAAGQVYAHGQDSGTDEAYGSQVSAVSAKATVPGVNSNLTSVVLAEEPMSRREAPMRANMEVRQILASLLRAQVVHRGWFRPGTGDLWKAGDRVTVKAPELFPIEGGTLDLRVWEAVCSQADATGTITALTLVNDAAFQLKFPDATKSDPFFSPGATGGELET